MERDYQQELKDALFAAHADAARQQNISTVVLEAAFQGNGGDFPKAVAAALCTLGDMHGPIRSAQELLLDHDPVAVAQTGLTLGMKVAGWGSSFVRGREDPCWFHVREAVKTCNASLIANIDAVTEELHRRGKRIHPNPACWTAASAIILGIHSKLSPTLFIQARLPVWTELCSKHVNS